MATSDALAEKPYRAPHQVYRLRRKTDGLFLGPRGRWVPEVWGTYYRTASVVQRNFTVLRDKHSMDAADYEIIVYDLVERLTKLAVY